MAEGEPKEVVDLVSGEGSLAARTGQHPCIPSKRRADLRLGLDPRLWRFGMTFRSESRAAVSEALVSGVEFGVMFSCASEARQ